MEWFDVRILSNSTPLMMMMKKTMSCTTNLHCLALPQENPKSRLRLVRFTNFDKPTVIVFQKQYEV
jgi:hypothetical protein